MYNYKNKKKPLFRGFFCFKIQLATIFLFTNLFLFSQEKLIETREIKSNEIEIITDGLDDIVIENSTNNQITVILLDENPNTHTVFFDGKIDGILKVNFKFNFDTYQEPVFRKYITKRLQRAKAIVKVPMNKNVNIHGKTIGVTSNDYQGDLSIYIDKGNVRLNKVKGNIEVKLFLGNVYAQLGRSSIINVKTNNGVIIINEKINSSPFFKKKKNSNYNFSVNSINANVILKEL